LTLPAGAQQLRDGAWFIYEADFLSRAEADELLMGVLAEEAWEVRHIVALGKEVAQPRLTAWGGDVAYRYSGQTLEPRPVSPRLQALTERLAARFEVPFNHVVLNRYRDGRDHIARHADNEPELGRNPLIAAVSVGAERKFFMERKKTRGRLVMTLGHGSLLVMGGSCQHTWRHALPPDRAVTEERVNLTWRWLRGPPGWRQPFEGARRESPPGPRG
jgi:alkylated DNA repair dioxygenase AlkB